MGVRVLHLTAGKLYGGIESSLLTIARFAHRCPGLEPEFVVCFEGRLSAELRQAGQAPHVLGEARIRWPWSVWRARRRLAELLARRPFDVAICHSSWPHVLFAPVVRSRGLPLVFWAHDVYRGRHWLERWSRWTPPDLVLANSEFTRSFMENLFPGVPSETIHQPVSPRGASDRASNRHDIRGELQTAEDDVVIIQSCRFERWKGHALLLAALGELAGVPGWTCWLAGGVQRRHEQQYVAELRQQATDLAISERVRFLGQRTDIGDVLAAADIHCQPNTGPEPFGVAFVEALHAGLPVVTTAMGGALEIIDETCGVLVPPEPEALAAALGRLIRDAELRQQLGGNGPARALHLSDPVNQLSKILMALRRVEACAAHKRAVTAARAQQPAS
jgi:glycosyltransferase involved in cell wall biosynthesis